MIVLRRSVETTAISGHSLTVNEGVLIKRIDGTGITRAVVTLIAIDAGREAVLETGVDRERVS